MSVDVMVLKPVNTKVVSIENPSELYMLGSYLFDASYFVRTKKMLRSNRLKNENKWFNEMKDYFVTAPCSDGKNILCKILYRNSLSNKVRNRLLNHYHSMFFAFNRKQAYTYLKRFLKNPQTIYEIMNKYEDGCVLWIDW